jgi:hypothetical protein
MGGGSCLRYTVCSANKKKQQVSGSKCFQFPYKLLNESPIITWEGKHFQKCNWHRFGFTHIYNILFYFRNLSTFSENIILFTRKNLALYSLHFSNINTITTENLLIKIAPFKFHIIKVKSSMQLYIKLHINV